VLLRENRHVLKKRLPEKSKIAVNVYEEGYMIGFGDERSLQIERSSRCQIYYGKAHVVSVKINISQHSLEISRVFIPRVSTEFRILGEALHDLRETVHGYLYDFRFGY
jgi:hypothetical protein